MVLKNLWKLFEIRRWLIGKEKGGFNYLDEVY